DGDSVFLADSANAKVVATLTELMGLGDVLLLGSKGMSLKQLRTFDDLVKQTGHLDYARQADALQQILHHPEFRAADIDPEGFVIKALKAFKGGGFNPKSTDLDLVPLEIERLVRQFDLLGVGGRDLVIGGNFLTDNYFDVLRQAARDQTVPRGLKGGDFQDVTVDITLGKLTQQQLDRTRDIVANQLFLSGFIGRAAGTEIDAAAWVGREVSDLTRLGGQIVGASPTGSLVRRATQPSGGLVEGSLFTTISQLITKVQYSPASVVPAVVGRLTPPSPNPSAVTGAASSVVAAGRGFNGLRRGTLAQAVRAPDTLYDLFKSTASGVGRFGNIVTLFNGNNLHVDPDDGSDTAPVEGTPVTTIGIPGAEAVLRAAEEAVAWWSELGGFAPRVNIIVTVTDLDPGVLGYGEITGFGADGRPLSGMLILDSDGNGKGWNWGETAVPDHYDLTTTIAHELGHIFGFTTVFEGYAGLVETAADGSAYLKIDGGNVPLAPDREHLNVGLMAWSLGLGVRKTPGQLEGAILQAAWGGLDPDEVPGTISFADFGYQTDAISYLHESGHLGSHGGF
ncbi:MAG: hypothetical protein KDL87_14915, partial [Verrucomicrobiae bacterium]|nr:hypothetical protein [Verrucomicrobiae bacterium]